MNPWHLRAALALVLAGAMGGTAAQREGGAAAPAAPPASAASEPQAPASTATAASLQFAFGEAGVVRVPATTTMLTATGIADLARLSPAEVAKLAQSLLIADRGVSRGPAAAGSFVLLAPEFVGRSGANGLAWRVPVKADVPAGTSHVRVATVSLGGSMSYAVEFTVSGKPAGTAQWTPRGATDVWTVSWSEQPAGRVFAVTIENPDEPVRNVRLAQSSLKDTSGRTIGVDRLRLVEAPAAPAVHSLDVPGNGSRTFFVRLEDAGSGALHGTFDGVLRLAADGSPAMKEVALKVQASSSCMRWAGVGLTCLGLLLTIFVSAYARSRMARLQALRAAAALRQGCARLEAELARMLPPDLPMPTTRATVAALIDSLTEASLDEANLLPSRLALAPGFEAAPDTAPALKARLETASKKLEGLLVLSRNGLPAILALLPARREVALKLAQELDAFAEHVTSAEDAKPKAEDVKARAQAARATESLGSAAPAGVSVQELDYEIRGLSLLVWGIWALIALAIGAAWIFSDADYGTVADLAASFAWGFGMTTFGAGLQNLTPASVSTQLKVKLPN
jgi:hypothetical protein